MILIDDDYLERVALAFC